jgi:hypothetical protein
MKIFPMGTEFFHAHGQTDATKLIVAFRSSANAAGTVTFTLARNIRWPEALPSVYRLGTNCRYCFCTLLQPHDITDAPSFVISLSLPLLALYFVRFFC